MGAPLELVRYNTSNGKFEVGEDAVNALRKVKGPVGVVAVCGRARQGKSYILNQLLKQASGGFQVGPTHRPCTKGLWMWSQPQQCSLPDGSSHHLVLLDTEGVDAYDQTGQYSTQIFCLAVLLSSLFVYNQMGGIDEAALDRLSLVTEMTKRIRVRANVQGAAGADELAQFTPSFLWLLRDFYLSLEEDGQRITPRDYLERALHPFPGSGASVEAKNMIRASIKALFPDRDCFTLVRPMNEEQHLVNLDRISRSQLRPEFLQGLEALTSFIFSKARPRRLDSMVVTGPILAGLVHAYVEAINAGAVPTIATAWQGVAESECRRAVDCGEGVYSQEFKGEEVEAEEAALAQEHKRALGLALATFEDIAVGEARVVKAHQERLLQACEARYQSLRRTRLAEAAALINELLYNGNLQLQGAVRQGNATTQQLQQLLKTFLASYLERATGPTKWQRLVEYLQDSYLAAVQQLAEANEQRLKQQLEEAQQKLQEGAWHLKEMEQTLTKTHQKASEADSLRDELARCRAEAEVAVKTLTGKVEALNAQMRDTVALESKKAQTAEEAAAAKVNLAAQQLAELQQALQAQTERHRQLQLQADTEAAKRQGLEGQLATARQEVEQLQRSSQAAAGETASKSQQVAQLQEQLARLQADVATVMAERDHAKALLSQQRARQMEVDSMLDGHMAEAQAASSSRPAGGQNFKSMTIQQLKDWLASNGHEDEAWSMATRSPAPKKSEWLQLVLQHAGSAANGTAHGVA